MSYILDALKKADAQRERDPARGIHAQPAALPTLQQPWIGQRPWFWAAAAAAIAALAAAGWFLSQEPADGQRAPVATSEIERPPNAGIPAAPAPLGTPAAASERVADAVLPPAAPAAPAAPAVVAAAQPKGAAPAGANAAPAANAASSGVPASAPAAAAPPPAPRPAVAAAPVPAAAARPPAMPVAAAPAVVAGGEPPIGNGLPADAPKLAISGGVYSANRAQRMLIVNGQVVNEGADLGGGIVLEEIRPKAAVLRFRGGRYTVGF